MNVATPKRNIWVERKEMPTLRQDIDFRILSFSVMNVGIYYRNKNNTEK